MSKALPRHQVFPVPNVASQFVERVGPMIGLQNGSPMCIDWSPHSLLASIDAKKSHAVVAETCTLAMISVIYMRLIRIATTIMGTLIAVMTSMCRLARIDISTMSPTITAWTPEQHPAGLNHGVHDLELTAITCSDTNVTRKEDQQQCNTIPFRLVFLLCALVIFILLFILIIVIIIIV